MDNRAAYNAARSWVETEPRECVSDVCRLGLDGAARYQMELISERSQDGDHRWDAATVEEMREELTEIHTRYALAGKIPLEERV